MSQQTNIWFCEGILPDELIVTIVNHLDIISLISASIVCKNWHANLWLYVSHFNTTYPSPHYLGDKSFLSQNVADNLLTRLDPLRISTLVYGASRFEINETFTNGFFRCSNLVGLTVLNDLGPEETYLDIYRTFTRLTSIEISSIVIMDSSITSQVSQLRQLKHLLVDQNESSLHWLSDMTQLTSLGIRNWPTEDVTSLYNLTNLVSMYINNPTESDLPEIAKLTHVTRLDTRMRYYDPALTTLTHLRHFATLYLRGGKPIPPNVTSLQLHSLEDSLTSLTNLVALRISNTEELNLCQNISVLTKLRSLICHFDNFDVNFIANLTHLTRLGLNDAPISREMVGQFSILTNLKVFEYSCFPRISTHEVAAWFPLKGAVIRNLE